MGGEKLGPRPGFFPPPERREPWIRPGLSPAWPRGVRWEVTPRSSASCCRQGAGVRFGAGARRCSSPWSLARRKEPDVAYDRLGRCDWKVIGSTSCGGFPPISGATCSREGRGGHRATDCWGGWRGAFSCRSIGALGGRREVERRSGVFLWMEPFPASMLIGRGLATKRASGDRCCHGRALGLCGVMPERSAITVGAQRKACSVFVESFEEGWVPRWNMVRLDESLEPTVTPWSPSVLIVDVGWSV